MAKVDDVPFDPVLGAKIFGEIQAEGLRAAGALVERLVHLVDGPRQSDSDPAPDTESPATPLDMDAVLPWFELWRDLIERTSDTLQRLQGGGEVSGGIPVGVVLGLDPAGRGQGELWLHNGTDEDYGELVPHCGPLCDADGVPLEADVDINPPKVDGLPSKSSRGFTITVTTDHAPTPGTYRGMVQVRGAEAVWMPIEVTVAASP